MKKLYIMFIILYILFSSANILGQPFFTPKTDFTTGNLPKFVAVGDFNGDGKPDMAVANAGTNNVSIFLNTTIPGAFTPTFTAKTDFGTGSGPVSVSIGDFNGDGKPDMAVANIFSTSVSVFLNTTITGTFTPSFTAKTDFATGTNPQSVSVGDFNGDLKPDLVLVNISSNTVSVLLNTTVLGSFTPSFSSKTDFATSTSPQSVSVGDFNGDLIPDIAVTNAGSSIVSVFLNMTTQGSFTPVFSIRADFATGSGPVAVSIGDFNGDLIPDIAVTNNGSSTVSIFLNMTVQGTFTPLFSTKTDFTSGSNPRSISIGDFDGDGKSDLAVTNFIPNVVSVYLNQTTLGSTVPSFSASTDFPTGTDAISVSVADFNGDLKPDLAVANQGANTVSVLLNLTGASNACITWDLMSSTSVTSIVGNLNGQTENIQSMSVFNPYTSNGQRLNDNWGTSSVDPTRYLEFNTSPTIGNSFTINNVSFNYGDFPLSTNSNFLKSQVFYSTDNWANQTLLTTNPLDYLNTSMSTFSATGLNVVVANGQTFSLRIFPYTPTGTSVAHPTFAIHNNLVICGTTNVIPDAACIKWDLTSSTSVTSFVGNISGQTEILGVGSPFLSTGLPANLMSIFGYNNGQKLWVGNTGATWVPDPPGNPTIDLLRYIQFGATPNTGNTFTITNVSFNYGDFPLSTNFNILKSQVYYSTNNWANQTLLTTSPLDYLNTSMSTFSATGLNVVVANGQTFSLRIYMYPVLPGIAMTPTFATHNNVVICGTTSIITSIDDGKTGSTIPKSYQLQQNYPNPFNPSSIIQYNIPKSSFVKISVYDILGREIRVLVNEEKGPGQYSVVFNAKNLASGIYLYSIRTADFTQVKKMILMK